MSSELLEKFWRNSASDRELVLPGPDALEALEALESDGVQLVGWEGWIRYPSRQLGHSSTHQGTVDLFSIDECRRTITESMAEWERSPEVPTAELLYCLTW